ncbi:hypothetical protein LR48_Vigan02g092300 [Vigna angularis]|uniref:Uncharacterized protein n=1 Tax=Phaseolus angularis TaxID=3914 RepID=A0A0L9TW06_PHAAN|nr:hypothetical protein LR48_Vigan02g092300 [Vigna angularis]
MDSEKNSKNAKEEKPQVLLSASLPLSGTQEHTLAPLRGENAAEGRFDFALVPLSCSLPLSGVSTYDDHTCTGVDDITDKTGSKKLCDLTERGKAPRIKVDCGDQEF